jgi:hypothetical protein
VFLKQKLSMKKILLMFFAAYAMHTTSIQSLAQIELTIKMTPMPAITLSGPSGEYQIQRAQVLRNVTKWITITNVANGNTKMPESWQ